MQVPRPPYPTPFAGYLSSYIEVTRHKVRHPKKGAEYEAFWQGSGFKI